MSWRHLFGERLWLVSSPLAFSISSDAETGVNTKNLRVNTMSRNQFCLELSANHRTTEPLFQPPASRREVGVFVFGVLDTCPTIR